MRFVIVNTDYPNFLNCLYAQHPGLEKESYEEQMRVRVASMFGDAGFASVHLRELGHEAYHISANNEYMQKAWAREHGLRMHGDWRWEFRLRRGLVPWLSRASDPWFYDILAAQIRHYKPDVLLNNDVCLSSRFFREMKPYMHLLIGFHGSPLPKEEQQLGAYDLMLSVVPNLVDYFRQQGIRSELLRCCFEPAALKRLGKLQKSIPVSFVGSLSRAHASRQSWLEYVCQKAAVQVWVPSLSQLPSESPIIRCHRGTVWGLEMYEILCKSLITLNHHINIAESYAGNGRLFEATGLGTLLITDWKRNLHEMFDIGKEVVAYRTPEECVEMIQYYLEHDDERDAISRAGQQRTLQDHTYYRRMEELLDIVQTYL